MARKPPKRLKSPDRIIPADQLEFLVETLKGLEYQAKEIRAFLKDQLEKGVQIPNAVLKPTPQPRIWDVGVDPDEDPEAYNQLSFELLREHFRRLKLPSRLDDLSPRKILGPSQVEKLLGKEKFSETLAEFAPSRTIEGRNSMTLLGPRNVDFTETEED